LLGLRFVSTRSKLLEQELDFIYSFAGLNRFVKDIEFMLNLRLSAYWKVTWAYVIPISLIGIFIYAMSTYSPSDIGSGPYPPSAVG
jgi:solute carrier family 6 (neurotransmitter transporter, glycine) member 5/9